MTWRLQCLPKNTTDNRCRNAENTRSCIGFWAAFKMLLAVGLLSWMIPALAQAPASFDPEADATLKKLCDYGQSLKVAKCEVTLALSLKTGATTSKMNVPYQVAIAPPNLVAIKPKPATGAAAAAGEMVPTLFSDGKQILVRVPTIGKYVLDAAPATLEEIAQLKHLDGTGLSSPLIAASLLPFRSYEALKTELIEARDLGEEKLLTVKCRRLKLGFKNFDADVWIDTTDKPTIRKVVPDLTRWLATNKDLPPAEMKPELLVTYKPWVMTGLVKPDDYKIVSPTGLAKVTAFDAPSTQTAAVHPLLDKPAPSFQLRLLQGGSVDLAAHKGKQVVILDFWATWCGPCVRSLPEVTAVASQFQSRGVAFYAVNLREEPEIINAFMTDKNWRMPVALDSAGSVAGLFAVRGIPQTVIIDREGVVKVVHVGAGPNIRDQLTQELNGLLSK